jgi:hypothetical protein
MHNRYAIHNCECGARSIFVRHGPCLQPDDGVEATKRRASEEAPEIVDEGNHLSVRKVWVFNQVETAGC